MAGCGSHGGGGTQDDGDQTRRWTIMVYVASDNDLEQYAIRDMNELESVGSTSRVSVVAQIDRIQTPSYDTSNGDWSTTRRYYITRDSDTSTIHSELVADLGELNMAAPETLTDFVQWAVQTYPADHYLLALWDHGRGWQTTTARTLGLDREIRAINIDQTDGGEMSLADLTLALEQSPHLDVVLLDACLMGMLEVAYSVRNCADIMLASEENVPVPGQPYQTTLWRITSNPGMSPLQLSRTVVDEYMGYYLPGSSTTLTYSAISLTSLDALVSAADQLADAILRDPSAWPSVRTAQEQTQRFDYDKGSYIYYKDLYDFASRLNSVVFSAEIRSSCQAVMAAVNDTVLYQRNSGGKVANAHGVSIYLPDSGRMLNSYRSLAFAQDTSWDEFLASY